MSGIEALSVVASSSQLAAYAIHIALHFGEIGKAARLLPARTREHQGQVRELIETTTLIERHQALRSPAIHAQLQSTLAEAQSLYAFLSDITTKYTQNPLYRYWCIIKGLNEEEISARFNNLEREKSALRLCISVVHTDILVAIQTSVESFSSTKTERQMEHGSHKEIQNVSYLLFSCSYLLINTNSSRKHIYHDSPPLARKLF